MLFVFFMAEILLLLHSREGGYIGIAGGIAS